MQLLVFTALALVVFLIVIGFDLGGTIAALFLLTILLVGGLLRAWRPLTDWLRGPASKL